MFYSCPVLTVAILVTNLDSVCKMSGLVYHVRLICQLVDSLATLFIACDLKFCIQWSYSCLKILNAVSLKQILNILAPT